MFPLSPVGFNFGIPPTNKPPSDMGPPLLELLLLLLLIAPELLVLLLLLLKELKELVDSFLTRPEIAGELLSTVTVFFRVLPALMDCSNKPLLSPTGGPVEAPACGGGGGGGTDILAILRIRRRRSLMRSRPEEGPAADGTHD